MENIEIRTAYMAAGIKQWQLAKALGLSETHFSRKLRQELSTEEKDRVIATIEKLSKGANVDA